MKRKILFGIPPHSHTSLAMDELESLRASGYECSTVSYGRNDQKEGKLKKLFATLRNALILVKKIRAIRPDYLYLNSRFEPVGSVRDFITLNTLRLLLRERPKIIIKSHGSDCSVLSNRSFFYRKHVIPFLTKTVDAWIFLSSEEKRTIEKFNAAMARRVHVIPNIICPERCFVDKNIKEKYGLSADRFVCLYAGRIVRVKGVFDIVEAVGHLKEPEKFQFVFVGDGPDLEELKAAAGKQPNADIIRFTGFLPDHECDQFYGTADVLIYPTADTEGFAMALFKSVACGMPVITTPKRAAVDYLSEPENTLWVQPGRPGDIAAALETLLTDVSLRKTMRSNNLKTRKKFSSQVVGLQLKHILDQTDLKAPYSRRSESEQLKETSSRKTPITPLI